MTHYNRMLPYLAGAAAVAVVLAVLGVPLGALLPFAFVLVCPLMMVLMMRGMSGMHGGEDHTGHDCDHDPNRKVKRPSSSPR